MNHSFQQDDCFRVRPFRLRQLGHLIQRGYILRTQIQSFLQEIRSFVQSPVLAINPSETDVGIEIVRICLQLGSVFLHRLFATAGKEIGIAKLRMKCGQTRIELIRGGGGPRKPGGREVRRGAAHTVDAWLKPDNRGVVESWDSFGVVVGAASGALIGLLFVAISVNATRIANHPPLYVGATRTLVLFAIPLVAAILVVTPRQADWVLGAELMVLGIVAGAALILAGRRRVSVDAGPESRLARTLDLTSPTLSTSLLTEFAGITLIIGGGGLFWLVPALILTLVGGMLTSWLLLVRLLSEP